MDFHSGESSEKKKRSKSKQEKKSVVADLSSIHKDHDDIINLNFVRKDVTGNINRSEHFKSTAFDEPSKVYGINQK